MARAVSIETMLAAAGLASPSLTEKRIRMLRDLAARTEDPYPEAMAGLAEAACAGFYSDWTVAAAGAARVQRLMRERCANVAREISMAEQDRGRLAHMAGRAELPAAVHVGAYSGRGGYRRPLRVCEPPVGYPQSAAFVDGRCRGRSH